jgi:hypothetical protein
MKPKGSNTIIVSFPASVLRILTLNTDLMKITTIKARQNIVSITLNIDSKEKNTKLHLLSLLYSEEANLWSFSGVPIFTWP